MCSLCVEADRKIRIRETQVFALQSLSSKDLRPPQKRTVRKKIDKDNKEAGVMQLTMVKKAP